MKFTLSWLKDHLDTSASPQDIAETLTRLGLEVEGVVNRAQTLSALSVGFVKTAEQHPNADRLKVCQVETKDGMKQIVCGAPNARAGIYVAYAPVGTYIPGIDVTLKAAKIRDVESQGMLCSYKELELGDDHAGIIELPQGFQIGTTLGVALGLDDPVFEISLTPNRADCTGVYGIARDLAAAGIGKLKPYHLQSDKAGFKSSLQVILKNEALCPHFAARAIRHVSNKQSPTWLKQRLESIGLRPISALVDITNYIMMDLGRPLHVYDLEKLKGKIEVAESKGGETLTALNDKTYTLKAGAITINDESGVIGLGGIVGGTSTGVDEHTKHVLVESALFDPITIARTGRALGVQSDARYRFERGVDPESVLQGILKATDLILDLCGGEAGEVVEAGGAKKSPKTLSFDFGHIKKRGGVDIKEKQAQDILKNLGFKVDKNKVTVPSWRPDIDGSADLVEEVLRVYGYDNVQAIPVKFPPSQGLNTSLKRVIATRRILAARGALEAISWSFMNSKDVKTSGEFNDGLVLQNPIASDLDHMRPSLIPNLLHMAVRNFERGYPSPAIFEVGPQFSDKGQERVAVIIRSGHTPAHWMQPERVFDVFDVKADVTQVLDSLQAPTGKLSRQTSGYYHPGRSGGYWLGKTCIACFGEVHPALIQGLKIKKGGPFMAGEIFLDRLPESRGKGSLKPALDLNPLQPVHRDFAFVVDQDVSASDLIKTVAEVDKNLITMVNVFDVYVGDKVEKGKKSLAVSVMLEPRQTLSEQDLEKLSENIEKNVEKVLGGVLRK